MKDEQAPGVRDAATREKTAAPPLPARPGSRGSARTRRAETPASAPHRNLRVWVESFDLALEVFQSTRRLEGSSARGLARRLIDASARVPVAVARGRASGSATGFIRGLHQALAELAALENALLACGQTGCLPLEEVRTYETRIVAIRRMIAALTRRLRAGREDSEPAGRVAPREGIRPTGREKGFALLMALLVAAALGVIGTIFLQMADSETRISAAGRDRDQLLAVAETGARVVKTWFDCPVSGDPSSPAAVRHALLGALDPRDPSVFDRSRRLIDADLDPSTPPVPADGSTGREWYRQGRLVAAGHPHLDLFHKPWRGGTVTSLLGTSSGPDLVLEDRPGVVDAIDRLNAALFSDQQTTGRIQRIEIHAPSSSIGPPATRNEFATVVVTAARYRALDRSGGILHVRAGAPPSARGVVRMGLAEIPVNAPRGPLEACGDITVTGPLRARWGRVIGRRDVRLAGTLDALDTFVASAFPYESFSRRISGTVTGGLLADWLNDPDASVEDPWLKVIAGRSLFGWQHLPDQPLPYDPGLDIDIDHSNLFQRAPGIDCARFDYDLWKRIAMSVMPGDRHLHYFAFDAATGLFRRHGRGPARSVRDWTDGRSGIFFFDTADGLGPAAGNLTPPVVISGGDWHTAGVVFLNAVSFRADGVRGVERVLLPPGEPFDDADHDLRHDATETFVNLRYATRVRSGTPADDMLKESTAAVTARAQSPDGETYDVATTLGRDPAGTPLIADVNLFGILYNSGDIVAEGDAVTYGSLVAGGSVTQATQGAASPWIFFDDRLNTGAWPPPEIAMPRTYITFWQTSRP